MAALLIGLLFIALGVWAILPLTFPLGLNWGPEVIAILKGGAPIIALVVGLIAFMIGIADIKDKAEEKKAEESSKE